MKNICKYIYLHQDLEVVLLKLQWALRIDKDFVVQDTKENSKTTNQTKKIVSSKSL